jgi:hypothetical protein
MKTAKKADCYVGKHDEGHAGEKMQSFIFLLAYEKTS